MSQRGTYAYKFCVCDFVTSRTNTLMEIGHGHLLDRICFERMTTLGVECYFKGMRADHDLPTVAHYAYRRARCVEYDMLPFLIFYWAQFILSGENYQKESKVNPQTAITEGTAKVAKTKTQGEKL